MNDRIKELTIRALVNCDLEKMTPMSSSVDNGAGLEIPLEFPDQLVALVVRECADFVATALAGKIGQLSAAVIATDLEDHFGVNYERSN